MRCMCISIMCGSTCVLCCVAVLCTAVREHCHYPSGGGATKAEVSERGFRNYVYVQGVGVCVRASVNEVSVCLCGVCALFTHLSCINDFLLCLRACTVRWPVCVCFAVYVA